MSDRWRYLATLLSVALLQAPVVVAVCHDAVSTCPMESPAHERCQPPPTSLDCCGDREKAPRAVESLNVPPSSRSAPPLSESWAAMSEPWASQPLPEGRGRRVDLRGSPQLFTLFSALLI